MSLLLGNALGVSGLQDTGGFRAAAERQRFALEAGEIGTWCWNLATGRMDWSAQMFRNLGVSPESNADDLYAQLIGAVHPSERELAETAFREFRMRCGRLRL